MKNKYFWLLTIAALAIAAQNARAISRPPAIKTVSWLPKPRRAMTIPPFGILVKQQYANDDRIINHELVHWGQYQQRGLFGFYNQYFGQLLTDGYDKMPLEIEARYQEPEYCKTHYTECYNKKPEK